jgi:hypothetical protein
MPGIDKSGPDGRGPKTGRGLGYCGGNQPFHHETDTPRMRRRRVFSRGLGRNAGRGVGGGQGMGRGCVNLTRGPDFEPSGGIPQTLRNEIDRLRDHLKALEDRFASLISKD